MPGRAGWILGAMTRYWMPRLPTAWGCAPLPDSSAWATMLFAAIQVHNPDWEMVIPAPVPGRVASAG